MIFLSLKNKKTEIVYIMGEATNDKGWYEVPLMKKKRRKKKAINQYLKSSFGHFGCTF